MKLDWAPDEAKFPSVKSHADQLNIYAENLAPDIAMWRGRNLTVPKLLAWARSLTKSATWRLMVFRKNKPGFFSPSGGMPKGKEAVCEGYGCNQRLSETLGALQNWSRRVTFPDAIWLMNIDDVQFCRCAGHSLGFVVRWCVVVWCATFPKIAQ